MAKLTKKYKQAVEKYDANKYYTLNEAAQIVKTITYTKWFCLRCECNFVLL